MAAKKKKPDRPYVIVRLSMPDPREPEGEELSVSVRADLKDVRKAVTDAISLGDEESEFELPVTIVARRVRRDLLRELRRATKR